jgi:hypothetical protein
MKKTTKTVNEFNEEAAIKLLQDKAKRLEEQATKELSEVVENIKKKYNVEITISGQFVGNQMNCGLVVKAK